MTTRCAKKSGTGAARASAALFLAAVATGCTVPVAVGLDEQDANRATTRSPKRDRGGQIARPGFRAQVAHRRLAGRCASSGFRPDGGESTEARAPGLLETLDSHALVPSRATNTREILAGISGELERTLTGVSGISFGARAPGRVPARQLVRHGARATVRFRTVSTAGIGRRYPRETCSGS